MLCWISFGLKYGAGIGSNVTEQRVAEVGSNVAEQAGGTGSKCGTKCSKQKHTGGCTCSLSFTRPPVRQ
jgi:hypothetical protein